MADIVTAAWALVVHDCDVKAGHVIETISSKYSRIPASVPEKKHVNSYRKQSKRQGAVLRVLVFPRLAQLTRFSSEYSSSFRTFSS